ncbi:hypothetical protein [Megasphaera sp.]|uniref:hypothetical protein n=1 Tax=Megasphaera sp. TaxID=2023260 RepID=UPI0030798BFF
MKFVIVSGTQIGGGPIVLCKLAQVLQKQGYNTAVFNMGVSSNNRKKFYYYYVKYLLREFIKILFIKIFPRSNFAEHHYQGYVYIPVKGIKRRYLPWVDGDTIVVYPEVASGNPLHAKHVVRWLLYYNRHNDDSWYSSDDLFVSYREQFFNHKLNPDNNLLKIFHFDQALYKRTNYGERQGVCYFIRKGKTRTDLPKKYDGPILDDLPEIEKVKILNQCERCYLYDTQTFYASIAALCGCIPIVVPEPGKTRKDYVKEDDKIFGVAYGDTPEEIEYAIRTRDKVQQRITNMLRDNEPNVLNFVKVCKDYFNLT